MDENEEIVHFAFRPSMKDILEVLSTCSQLKVIQVPKSYNNTISKSLKNLFELKGIILSENDVWGHRTDMDEYLDVPVDRIKALSKEGKSVKEISLRIRISEVIIDYVLT